MGGSTATTVCHSAAQDLELGVKATLDSMAGPSSETRASEVAALTATARVGSIAVNEGQALVVEASVEAATYAAFDLYDDYVEYAAASNLTVRAVVRSPARRAPAYGFPKGPVALRGFALDGDGDDYTQNQEYRLAGAATASFYFPDLPEGEYDVSLEYALSVDASLQKSYNATSTLTLGDHVVVVTAVDSDPRACYDFWLDCDASCVDDADFEIARRATHDDASGDETCADWTGYDCGAAESDHGFDADTVAALLAACPLACGACADPCADGVRAPRAEPWDHVERPSDHVDRKLLAVSPASHTRLCHREGGQLALESKVGVANDDDQDDARREDADAVSASLQLGHVNLGFEDTVLVVEATVESAAVVAFWHQSSEYDEQWYDAEATLELTAVVQGSAFGGVLYHPVPRALTLQALAIDGFTDDYYTQNEALSLRAARNAKFVFTGLPSENQYVVELVFSLSTRGAGRGLARARVDVGTIVASTSVMPATAGDCGAGARPSPKPTAFMPTPKPTFPPIPAPTISFQPTPEPTISFQPTADPTFQPTTEPTFEPTTEPTFQPTLGPEPTFEPTPDPTAEPSGEPTWVQEV